MPDPEHLDRRRAALIAYDACRRALTPSDSARRSPMRGVLDAWVRMIAVARAAGVPVIYTTPVSHSALLEPRGTRDTVKNPGVPDVTTWSVTP